MSEQFLFVVAGLGVGLFCLFGGLMNWDWFMDNRKARRVVRVVGRPGARVFSGLLGLGFMSA